MPPENLEPRVAALEEQAHLAKIRTTIGEEEVSEEMAGLRL